MFSKVLIFALAAAVANCQVLSSHFNLGHGYGYGAGLGLGAVGGLPVYKSSANYGGLYAANGWGYGANLGKVAGLGALRTTGAIVGGGALGYGTGAFVAPTLGYAAKSVVAAPAAIGVAAPAAYGAYGIAAKGLSVHQAGPVNAAVHTVARTVDYRPVPYTGEPATVQDIDVPPQESPLRINFQSKSSPLQVTQQHIPAEPGQVQVTQSEDEPQTAIHNVVRPVVQQVNEVVQPYRSLTQTVEPVIEQTHTNIAQGEGVRLTGLTSGVVGGTGVLAASGLGVAAPAAIGVAAPAVASYGYARPAAIGLAGYKTAGLGLATTGLYGSGLGVAKVGGLGYGLGYGSSLYGAPVVSGAYRSTYGIGGYGLGGGLALNGLSGLSGYGTTATKVIQY